MTSVRVRDGAEPLASEATALRRDILAALFACGGGHYGGSLSVLDLLLTLYRRQLRVDPETPRHPDRDRLLLSKGHAALALYAVQRRLGYFAHPLDGYGSFGSPLEGHPDMTALESVDFSTGSLGQGLSVGAGMALALRGGSARVWVVLGDGECQEGQIWEAALFASQLGLERLHAVVDVNHFQECGGGSSAEPVPELAAKWASFGWRVLSCDGHEHDELALSYAQASESRGQPSVVLARTVKGKGVGLAERDPLRFHCTQVTREEHAAMLSSLR